MRLDILRFSHSTRALRFSGRRKYGSYKGHPLVFRLSSDQNSKIPDTDDSESSIQSSTSSSSDEHDATNASARKNIFPWRHEEDLLPRIIPGTLDNATKGHLLSTTKMTPGNSTLNALATSFMFLDVPLYQFLFFGSWKEDLAESMSWAFTQGTTGLLSNLATHGTYFSVLAYAIKKSNK